MAEQVNHRHRAYKKRSSSEIASEPGFAEAVAEAMDDEEQRRRKLAGKTETLATIVLSIAAVATAWSAYQSTRWNGEQAGSYTEAGAYRSESLRASGEAEERTGVAVTLTADWISAEITNNGVLADALRSRMPPDLEAAMQRWLGDWQRGQPLPPGDPFTTGGYTAPETAEVLAFELQAEESFNQGRDANQYSDNYVLTGVVFALALFFAGVASRFGHPSHAVRMVYVAGFLVALGCLLLVIQPKSIGV